ncbi:MAG: hypothetical protein KH354_08245 [Clostridiales bacterium]|nr:hypothetical protein [Clostridiales bacterium]
MKYVYGYSPAFYISFFSFVKEARGIANCRMQIPHYAPLTIPRNPLKRLFGAVGVEAFCPKAALAVELILQREKQADFFAHKLREGRRRTRPLQRPLYRGRFLLR